MKNPLMTLGLVCLTFLIFAGCESTAIERHYNTQGKMDREIGYKTIRGGNSKSDQRLLHGMMTTWREDGSRESLRIFINGLQQGYAFHWNSQGKLTHLEHWTDGHLDWAGSPTETTPTTLAER